MFVDILRGCPGGPINLKGGRAQTNGILQYDM